MTNEPGEGRGQGEARRLALAGLLAGLVLSGLGMAVALAGWVGMMAMMQAPMPLIPMQ